MDFNPFDGDGFDFIDEDKKGTCSWLFKPDAIRKIFNKYLTEKMESISNAENENDIKNLG